MKITTHAAWACLLGIAIIALVPRYAAASYIVADDQTEHGAPGPLHLVQTSGLVTYIENANYRVYYASFTITNNSATVTYPDVKLVDPFSWLNMSALTPAKQVAGWANAQYQWINPDYNGNDEVADGLYIKTYNGPDDPSEAALLMSDTNIPLTSPFGPGSGYETSSVLSTDQVPSWDIDASLTPGETISFKLYWNIERRSTAPTVSGKYEDLYIVSTVPEPATMALVALGGLVLLRRKR